MATAIRPFLDPDELEVLIVYHTRRAIEAMEDGDPAREKMHLDRAKELTKHRSVS